MCPKIRSANGRNSTGGSASAQLQNRRVRSRRGAVSVWLLLALTGILGIAAIGLDGGRMFEERRRVQSAADAAALAAAKALYETSQSSSSQAESAARDAALATAAANGYDNDGTSSIVTVNVPPQSGTFRNRADHAEVTIQANVAASFSRLFTREDLPVQARAVALGRTARIGLILLRPSGPDAFLSRALAFTAVGSPVIVNSDDPSAFHQDGLGVLIASSFEVTGQINNAGGIMIGKKSTGVRPTADPLRFLPVPGAAALPLQSAKPMAINSVLPTILSPGVYQGGIKISGVSSVIMQPGIYYMEGGGFEIADLATVVGVGVMIYNGSGAFAAGPVAVQSTGKIALVPPAAGIYKGIGIFQERSSNQPIRLTGLGTTAIAGLVYAPAAPISLKGLAAIGIDTLGGAYIASSMLVEGVGSINLNLGNNLPRIPEVVLVE